MFLTLSDCPLFCLDLRWCSFPDSSSPSPDVGSLYGYTSERSPPPTPVWRRRGVLLLLSVSSYVTCTPHHVFVPYICITDRNSRVIIIATACQQYLRRFKDSARAYPEAPCPRRVSCRCRRDVRTGLCTDRRTCRPPPASTCTSRRLYSRNVWRAS